MLQIDTTRSLFTSPYQIKAVQSSLLFAEKFGSLSQTDTEKAGSARPEEGRVFKTPRQIVSAVPQPIPHPQLSD